MTKTEREEIKTYVIDLLKESGDAGIKGSEIEKDCNLNGKQRLYLLKTLSADHPELVVKQQPSPTGGHESVYFWIEKPVSGRYPTHSPFLKNRYEKTNKNNEGYTDMTATAAIKNVTSNETKDWIKPEAGEIWVNEESNGKNGYIFVLGFDGRVAPCIRLFDIEETIAPQDIQHAIRIKLGAVTYIGDCGLPTHKYKKYLIRRARGRKDEELMKVRKEVAEALGIEAFRIKEVEVPGPVQIEEKIVFKDREVPDGCVDKRDADLAMAKKEAEIWRNAFWGLTKTLAPQNRE